MQEFSNQGPTAESYHRKSTFMRKVNNDFVANDEEEKGNFLEEESFAF